MKEKFLKVRVPNAEYQALQMRAAEAGQRLGTLVRDILQRDAQTLSTEQALARIEASLAAAPAASVPTPDHNLHRDLLELRLLVREIAMHSNAQILSRVAAQLASQTTQGGAP